MAEPRDYLDLVRAPASLTVIGDTLAGAAAAGRHLGPRAVGLPVASMLLYSAGMALNDYADADLDAVERPERPIPSGRISRARALGVASGLTLAGIAAAAVGGGRQSVALAVPLAVGIWTYDLVAKPSRLGPVIMASCRALDVLMGAGSSGVRHAAPTAGAIAVHTASVTALSRGEVNGTHPTIARAAAATTSGVGAYAMGTLDPVGVVAGGRYLAAALPGQLRAAESGDAVAVRTATRSGIRAMIPLQASLAARAGRPVTALALVALDIASAALLGRRRTRTADIT